MTAFPSILPLNGVRESVKQESLRIKFGDGFEQRLVKGLPANKRLIVLQMKFNISETDFITIDNFLNARFDDQQSFTFTLGNKYTGFKFICTNRSSSIPFLNRRDLNLTLEQVAEP
tara:strand:- start:1507 stop:1854 length:348 start_codon:yes stop_codon:yes gene_type:complete